ncbi:cytochrome-c peroxidase [Palleronia caenipelagi]|uniref:Methylamine utilization protein MauG n=1 Tax=Palleronia caenipelagi TaxID=2489174 RepID=A0A547QA87_9RHOB|nr:cytochrome c peroxidase [Palleronia caenipelagi]TRD23327.1 methylamine utilization protein MauG [Palleronia caenipelagi]
MIRTALLSLSVATAAHAGPLPDPLTAEDFPPTVPAQVKLGQLLFHDKILSGNRNIACSTCHSLDHGGGDGLSLGIGEGGRGIGPERTTGDGPDRIRKRIPRNAPGLWNLGARQIRVMFHDGRLEVSDAYENGFDSPAEEWLPDGLPNILAAQAAFPIVAQFEMAGNPRENEIAGAIHDRIDAAWPLIAKRVRTIPAYGQMFVEAFPRMTTPEQITIVEIATALGAYMSEEFRVFDTPFDAYLAGDGTALTDLQKDGMALFYGKAACDTCHSGTLLSDQEFHALALPGFGPGRTRRFDPLPRDQGRIGASDRLEDAYRFRTPMLRNVTRTAPYGHNGAYPTLRGIVEHHLDPLGALDRWEIAQANLPKAPWLAAVDTAIMTDPTEPGRLRAALDITPVTLSNEEIDAILAFLDALTGPQTPRIGRPDTVPSGLEVD